MREELSPIAVVVLGQFLYRTTHAYEVFRQLKQHGEERRVRLTVGAVYHAVARLESDGRLEAVGVEREGCRPERTTYRITDAGRAAYLRSVESLVRCPGRAYPPFEIGLSQLGALGEDVALAALRARRDAVVRDREDLVRVLDGVLAEGLPARFLLDGSYEVAQLGAQADWLEATIDAVVSGRLDWDQAVPPTFRPPAAPPETSAP